ncbi:MAG: helix-turn-helix domain-containing protein [Acidimicrobiales bacterium]
MLRWQSRGELLRWWRTDVAGLSQRQLAEELGVARTAVTNWERGSRMASIDADRIDEAMKADGVLAGWLWSFDTPAALDPRLVWSTVYPGASSPVWMWVRSPQASIGIQAEWGMYRFEGDIELGENGLLVTVGVSIEASPVAVLLSGPGWVDFGRGEVPPNVAGAPVVDAVDMVMPSSASGVFTELLATNIAKQFEDAELPEIARLRDEALKPDETFLKGVAQPAKPDESDGGDGLSSDGSEDERGRRDRARFTRMREARQLSLAETSQRLASMTTTTAGKDTLRRFEANIGEPHDPLLPAALDHVLGAEGHLALVEISSGSGTASVSVPRYWQGPVWIDFRTTEPDSFESGWIAELQWGNWHRLIEGELPQLIVNHAALIPLRILAAPEIEWTAGLGRRPGAKPINHGWVPDSIDTTQQALSTYQDALLTAIRHANEHRRH